MSFLASRASRVNRAGHPEGAGGYPRPQLNFPTAAGVARTRPPSTCRADGGAFGDSVRRLYVAEPAESEEEIARPFLRGGFAVTAARRLLEELSARRIHDRLRQS